MKILFMGTDKFAVPSLEALAKQREVVGVVTRRDKPRGRGRQVTPTAVKETAEALGIPVFEPKSLKSKSFREELSTLEFDLIVLVAYGRLLPEDFIDIPNKGSICLHPSKLPEYRGCSPIECAIRDGKERTGISVFFIEKEIDRGDVIYQKEVDILPDDTGGTLRDRLALESPDVILKTLELLEEGCAVAIPQDDVLSSYAPKITRDDARIDWKESADCVINKIRAFNPKPGAFTHFRGKILKINSACMQADVCGDEPGVISVIKKNEGFTVACGRGCLTVTGVQPEGKKAMEAGGFIAGYKPEVGEKFE